MSKAQNESVQKKRNSRNHRLKRNIIIAAVVVILGATAWIKFSGGARSTDAAALFTVERGDLPITVLESGKIKARKSVNLSCEVEGQSTIISIVPEGTYVNEGDVLVVLDSSDLRERIDQQEITVETAKASYTGAQEAKDIQENQNESDIKAAQLSYDFAGIDLEKYTGGDQNAGDTDVAQAALDFAKSVLDRYEGERLGELVGESEAEGGKTTEQNQEESDTEAEEPPLDLTKIDPDKFTGGDWHQQLRNALYAIVEAHTNLKLAEDQVRGTRELYKKGYVTKTKLKGDESTYQTKVIALKKAAEELRLLIKYDHPKQLTQLTADQEEAGKELERANRRAKSQLAQKEADLKAKEATYLMQKSRLEKLKEQLEKTTIKAPQPGLVIYASSTGEPWRRDRGLIAEGENVYERQKLIELPDLAVMKVDVNIHESVRDIINEGQEAIVTVEAVRGQDSPAGLTLRGHVEKVAILPDSGHRWMNPDLTVYPTSVIIDGKSEALKPGMTAKVEIMIADLKDVLYVPVQAVTVRGDQEVCYLAKGHDFVQTPVEVGLSDDNYVEIKPGSLKKGDKVLTYAPVAAEEQAVQKKARQPRPEKEEQPRADQEQAAEKPEAAQEGPAAPAEMGERPRRPSFRDLTPEQRKEFEQRLKEAGIEEKIDWDNLTPEKMREIGRKMMERGGMRREGQGRPEGTPSGEGSRRGRRGPRPSTEAPSADRNRALENP